MADASCLLNGKIFTRLKNYHCNEHPSFNINLISDEMRGALLTIITRKEELQAETRALRRMLEHSQDECGEARAELEQTNRVNVEKVFI